MGPVGTAEEIEIFHDFIDWMELCGHDLDEETIASRLHSTTHKFKRATAKEITMMLKGVGADHDLEGFTGKSLRWGASSAFTAAGYSDSVILIPWGINLYLLISIISLVLSRLINMLWALAKSSP